MSEPKDSRKNISNLQTISQANNVQEIGKEGSQKMLSPFTWSNIKLPTINKKIANPVIIEVNETVQDKKQKSRQPGRINRKIQSINKTIDVAAMKKRQPTNTEENKIEKNNDRYRRQSHEPINKSINQNKKDINGGYIQNLRAKRRKSNVLEKFIQKKLYMEQIPIQRRLNQTFYTGSNKSKEASLEIIKFRHSKVVPHTFSFTKIEPYLYKGIIKAGWNENFSQNTSMLPQLVWSDSYMESYNISPNQIHNHMKNINILTTKITLHEMQAINESQFYPQSYLLPFEYENFCQDYEQYIIKICLKEIIKNASQIMSFPENSLICLGALLPEMTIRENVSEESFKALRLCLYLQNYRRIKNYRCFQDIKDYIPIQTRLIPSVLSSLLKDCYQYWQNIVKNKRSKNNVFDISKIDSDILEILNSYHCVLLRYEDSYKNISNRNAWIVKPIASSRGAGISLLKNSPEFLSFNHDRYEMPNKAKYNNKIIQKYIEQPLLLKFIQPYVDRKFDIRQWVLITYDKISSQPLIYIYEDAYCRFSELKYTFNCTRTEQNKIHLTNYSILDKLKDKDTENSVLLLSQVYNQELSELKEKYDEQITKIVVETVMNSRQIKFQANRFQLLGYDVIFDQSHKLWLLEINLNPACESTRNQKLEAMAERMVRDMLNIVRAASNKDIIHMQQKNGWKLVLGQQNFKEVQFPQINVETKIKPYYSLSLGKDSLIELVRKRNHMGNM